MLAGAMASALVGCVETMPAPPPTFQDCVECPEMVVVPAGSFAMGYRPSDHRVTIACAFALGKYEVTFSQWDACVAQGGCGGYRPDDKGWGRGRRPVINVTKSDAKSYAKWLSESTGGDYRLPSEAEWEYAARAGTTGPFHFGDTIAPELASYDERFPDPYIIVLPGEDFFENNPRDESRERTFPVGSFPANRFGLHDVHGNVGELVEDCWHDRDDFGGAPTDGSAWIAGGDCRTPVLRGGSWGSQAGSLHAASRGWAFLHERGSSGGFRVARSLGDCSR